MDSRELLIQGIGFLGVLMFIISYQLKSNRALFVFQSLGSGLFCLQFFIMGQFSGSFSLMVNIFRNLLLLLSGRRPWARWQGWLPICLGLCLAILIFTWKGPLSLLPFLSITVSTVLYWTNNAQRIRLANLVCASPSWLLYDIIIGSWGGVLTELFTLGSILISIYRYGWKALGENRFGD
ncbi:MAG: YgjV family protein [Firmicutes bacterium]|nr:YgjV family protein [Bacillota bacterium]